MRSKSDHDRFSIVKRGYDPDAVEAHLSTLAADHDATLDEAAAQIAALEVDLEESRKHEEAVHLTILAATKTKEDMLEAAQRKADEMREEGRQNGDAIITDARMQAFQVVTEARKEAEDIVGEARAEAAAVLRAPEVGTTAAAVPNQRERELQHRIEEMQVVIAAMESELRARPVDAHDDTHDSPEHFDVVDESDPLPEIIAGELEDNAPDAREHDVVTDDSGGDPEVEDEADLEIVVTDTAATTPEPVVDSADEGSTPPPDDPVIELDTAIDDPSITDERADTKVRRSFYSRRSAKLPRIGVEAGRGAMAAAAGLRTNLTSGESDGSNDSDRSEEFEPV